FGEQEFAMLFDSGSADFWVPGIGCTNADSMSKLNPQGIRKMNRDFKATYGIGEVSGSIYISSFNIDELTVTDQIFGIAQTLSADFTTSKFDGIMGFGLGPSQTGGLAV